MTDTNQLWRRHLFTEIKKKIPLSDEELTLLVDATEKYVARLQRFSKSTLVHWFEIDSYKITPIVVDYIIKVEELTCVIISDATTDTKDEVICNLIKVVAKNVLI